MKNAILLVFALCSINQAQAEGFIDSINIVDYLRRFSV